MLKKLLTISLLISSLALLGQRKRDPFSRAPRLPDLGFGVGYQMNTENKYKVESGSITINATYYNFNNNYMVGGEYTTNLAKSIDKLPLGINLTEVLSKSVLNKLIYNHNILSLRGGWLFSDNFFLVGTAGVEILDQFKSYEYKGSLNLPENFEQKTSKSSILPFTKIGLICKINKWGGEFSYSKRGISFGINYFLND